tara:strand:- start:240 stop:509 length:270 start_codon:yes stop_codon:yes gene_type:complete
MYIFKISVIKRLEKLKRGDILIEISIKSNPIGKFKCLNVYPDLSISLNWFPRDQMFWLLLLGDILHIYQYSLEVYLSKIEITKTKDYKN